MRTTTITIDVTFGSDLQHDAAMKTLEPLLETWASFVREKHRKNAVTWSVAEGDQGSRSTHAVNRE